MPLSRAELDAAYPRAYQLLGGYFNQDWYFEYDGSAQAALNDYVSAFDALDLARTASEIDTILTKNSDDGLKQLLRTLHHSYMYEDDGYTARTWLEAIRDRLGKR